MSNSRFTVNQDVVEKVKDSVPSYSKQIPYVLSFLQPPPKISVSEWADKNRVLTSEDSPETGIWVTDKAPYQREMMDAIGDPLTEQVVLLMASQTGKTAGAILNSLGYFIDIDPCPILVVYPTVTMAEKVSRQRISPMVRHCPALRAKIRTAWKGDRGMSDSLLLKSFPGGMLVLGGAEKPDSLSSFPMRVILLDEIDRYKQDVGEEGDPVQLAITRASNFWNRKIILSSTPTIKGTSRIEFAYEDSSQGHWHLSCPGCGVFQELRWSQIDYTNYGGRILCTCNYCKEAFTKVKWLAQRGKWVHVRPNHRIKGYFANALISPWVDWDALVTEWIRANRAKKGGNNTLLKTFINTRLAETYEDYSIRVEPHILYQRREVYHNIVPDGVFLLTAGVDVQDIQKRINYEIVGWGKDYSSWGIEYGTIMANPREEEWKMLFDEMVYNRVFTCLNGKRMRVRKCLMDSNGAIGPYVYKYTRGRQPRIYSSKGSGHEKDLVTSFTGTYRIDEKYNTTWYPLNTIMGKDEMFQRLMVADPTGMGYCHFPCGPDEEDTQGYTNEYFEGLTSEQKRESVNNLGFTVYKYHKEGASRSSGEPLDCRVYARCALELAEQTHQLARMSEPDYLVGEGKGTRPFFDTSQKSAKVAGFGSITDASASALSEMAENQPTTTKRAVGNAAKRFGSFGTSLRDFNPYSEG